MAATAADPVRLRKSRRENPLMATLPHMIFYGAMMRHAPAFRKQTRIRRGQPTQKCMTAPLVSRWALP
jgi:hypothetical protein